MCQRVILYIAVVLGIPHATSSVYLRRIYGDALHISPHPQIFLSKHPQSDRTSEDPALLLLAAAHYSAGDPGLDRLTV